MEMEDPLILAAIGLLLVGGGVAIAVGKKAKKSGNSKKKRATGKAKVEAETKAEEQPQAKAAEENAEDWDWGVSSSVVDDTKVSVQDVDALTEFNVYKQFGYYDKAAESLAAYLNKTQRQDKALVSELIELWLEAKNVDAATESLMQYQNLLAKDEIEKYIKAGLQLDENHLGLRVLAESALGWTVKKTAEEIGEKTGLDTAKPIESKKKISTKQEVEQDSAAMLARQLLVVGKGKLGDISSDEKGAVLAFMEPEQGVKLLKDLLSYDAAIKYLNKAIRGSEKPASLLIDALTLDYRNHNINGFASHLWNLYYSLGQYGRQVKERMLGWGYSMGQHPLFERLEANPNEAALRDIGIQQGWIDGGSLKKARYQALVIEKADVNAEPRTPAERILKESESLLMYGQLENSMELLENAIVEYPQESQLYIALFDLYERAEEWDRLETLLQELRSQVKTLPEEVVLAMSQLLQRLNNGSFGH